MLFFHTVKKGFKRDIYVFNFLMSASAVITCKLSPTQVGWLLKNQANK